jgi:hypothetical protein
MFGTNDVVYVPEGKELIFDDVYRWKRFKLNVHQFGLRIRPVACENTSDKIRGALELCGNSPRFKDSIEQIKDNTKQIISDLAGHAGQVQGSLFGSLPHFFQSEKSIWWVHLSDLPGESFYEEDYENNISSPTQITPYETFGLMKIAQLDLLNIELVKDEENKFPLAIDTPEENGLTRWTIPPTEPLHLVKEFCGVHGVSANGRTINIDSKAAIPEGHQFCTPLGILGKKIFATLYVNYDITPADPVTMVLTDKQLEVVQKNLEDSDFKLVHTGPTWRILEREGDVVHLYSGLAGKETEGVETMPHFLLVVSSGGSFDPAMRNELLEAIKQTL